jgi:hypothetical protein
METRILELFSGSDTHYADLGTDGATPRPVAGRVTPETLREHLEQRHCYGFYLMHSDSTVSCAAIDIDNHGGDNPAWLEQVRSVYHEMLKRDLSVLIERSQSGVGAHLWVCFSEPVPAVAVRRLLYECLSAADVPAEVYPKQDTLSGRRLGNLIRYPLWGQSAFISVLGVELDTEAVLEGLTQEKLERNAEVVRNAYHAITDGDVSVDNVSLSGGRIPEAVQALLDRNTSLRRRWLGVTDGMADTSRSAVAQSIANALIKHYISPQEVLAALKAWGAQNGLDKVNRTDWMNSLLASAYSYVRKEYTPEEAGLEWVDDDGVIRIDPPEWLVKDVLLESTLAMLWGKYGSYKTFVALDWCLSVAANKPWLGQSVLSGQSVYVIGEGVWGIGKRVRAWKQFNRFPLDQKLGLRLFKHPIQLSSDKDVSKLLLHLDGEIPEPRLVVFDTLNRCCVGVDENSAHDMSKVVANLDRIKNSSGASVLVVHHAGKMGLTERGSSVLSGACDSIIRADGDAGLVTLTCIKQKDSEPFQPFVLLRQTVEDSVVLVEAGT